jgi:restriction system protein
MYDCESVARYFGDAALKRDRERMSSIYLASQYVSSDLNVKVQAISNALIRRLAAKPELMFQLSPRQFEELMAELYAREGFEVKLTAETCDDGVDLYLVEHTAFGRLLTIVDCKRNNANRPVGVGIVRQMLGTIDASGASAGVLATTSRFSSGAVLLSEKYPFRLGLQDYCDLHAMLVKTSSAYTTKPGPSKGSIHESAGQLA